MTAVAPVLTLPLLCLPSCCAWTTMRPARTLWTQAVAATRPAEAGISGHQLHERPPCAGRTAGRPDVEARCARTWSAGLHFNLTEGHGGLRPGPGARARSLPRPTWAGLAGRGNAPAVWRVQLDAFEAGHGHGARLHRRSPTCAPTARACAQALLEEMTARYARTRAPLGALRRCPPGGCGRQLQGAAPSPSWAAGPGATRLAHRPGCAAQPRLSAGCTALMRPRPAAYGAHMAIVAAPRCNAGSLLMCHPAAGVVEGDAIGTQRPKECAYLLSDEFVEDLQRFGRHIHQGGACLKTMVRQEVANSIDA